MVREELASKLSFRPVTASRGPRPCGVAPPSYSMGQGVKLTEYTSPSTAQVKNTWSYASASPLCHYSVGRDNLYLSTWTYPKFLRSCDRAS